MTNFTTAKTILIAALAFTLSACSNTFRSDVATFHNLPVPSGEKVSILPMDETKQDSIEFQQYAAILANHLQLEGYQQAGDGKPDLIVGFDVMINDGREKLDTRPTFSSPHHVYWRSYWHYGYFWEPYDPFPHNRTEIVAHTVYTVTLNMEVRKPNGELLFEGRAETETRSKAVPEVVPLLVEALFAEFPGPSGITRTVKIDLDENS